MWKILAFLTLGLLIGNIVAMSASPLSLTLIGLLFTFAGGSAYAFSITAKELEKNSVEKVLFSFALGCLVGIYFGIYVNEHNLLSSSKKQTSGTSVVSADIEPTSGQAATKNYYLRSMDINNINHINQLYRNERLSAEAAYDSLYNIIQRNHETYP